MIRAPAPIASLRVTDFRALLADPYRWALGRVFGLEPLADDARELDGRAFGSLAHEVLHRFGDSDRVHAEDAQAIRTRLDAALDEIVRRRFGRSALPAVAIQIEQLRARLHRFADWHAAWIADGWRVVAVERRPEEGVPFDVDGEPIRLRGRVDRIDRNERTGEWALLDYKTSDRPTDPDRSHRKGRGADREWKDLQLPLYRHLLPALELPVPPPDPTDPADPTVVRLGYVLLPRELDEVGAALADWSDDELADADEAARSVVRTLREDRFEFVFDPDRTAPYRDDPFAALLGADTLRRATAADGEEGDDDG